MKYLKIQNNGELDIRLFSLMGGTTKANDQFKIGQWGSGLKYSLAYLLKMNIDFKIFVGRSEIKIGTETESIRDEDFEIITVNGERTSITTNMGGNAWKPWTIVRELWCNALDEGGEVKETTSETFGIEGKTTFFIQITEEIREVIVNWGKYFIHELTPMFENEYFRIYEGGDRLRLYKQGVLIHESKVEQKSLFSYDLRDAEINELREFKGSIEAAIYNSLRNANEKVIRYFIENLTDDHYEGKSDLKGWSFYGKFGEEWAKVLGNTKIIHQKAVDNIKARELDIDLVSTVVVPKNVYDLLTGQFEGVGALRLAAKNNEFYEIYDEDLELMNKQALTLLETCGYFIHPELQFCYGAFGDKRTLAKVNLDDKTIYISEQMKHQSLFQFVAMLIEENEHFNTGFEDETRQFQQHFINLFTKTLLNKNEIIL